MIGERTRHLQTQFFYSTLSESYFQVPGLDFLLGHMWGGHSLPPCAVRRRKLEAGHIKDMGYNSEQIQDGRWRDWGVDCGNPGRSREEFGSGREMRGDGEVTER